MLRNQLIPSRLDLNVTMQFAVGIGTIGSRFESEFFSAA